MTRGELAGGGPRRAGAAAASMSGRRRDRSRGRRPVSDARPRRGPSLRRTAGIGPAPTARPPGRMRARARARWVERGWARPAARGRAPGVALRSGSAAREGWDRYPRTSAAR